MSKQDYKARIYEEYYRTHIAPRKAAETGGQIRKKFKVFDMHFGFSLPNDRNAKIIDAGCGNGSLVYWLQSRGYHDVLGVDGSPDQIAAGQALGIDNLFVGNLVAHLAERPGYYDMIFLRDVLEHFAKEDVLSALDICYQALRPGGRIVIQLPNGASPFVGRVLYGDFTHEFALTQSSVSQLFLLAGFSNITVRSYLPHFPRLSVKMLFQSQGRAVLVRYLAWSFVRRLYALMLFAEIGRHNTVVTFNLIAAGTRPVSNAPGSVTPSPWRSGHPNRSSRRSIVQAVGKRLVAARHRMGELVKPLTKRISRAILQSQIRRLPDINRLPRADDVKQILMLGDMGIGNFIMLTPLLRNLRQAYPGAEIVMLFIKARGADLVAERLDSVDRIIRMPEFRHGRAGDAIAFRRALAKYDLAPQILLGRFNGSPFIPLLGTELRPAWRVGHVSSAGFKAFSDEVFNYPVVMRIEQHEVDRNLDLARALGIPVDRQNVEFPVTEAESAQAEQVLQECGIDPTRLICLQMGSSEVQSWKRWPASHWRELLDALHADGWQLGLVGSDSEHRMVAEIAAGSSAVVVNFCGRFDLGTSAALLQRSRLLICNDSGLMHVAAAVGTPIIGLFGPTEFERTRPWCDRFIGLRGACKCNQGTLFDRNTLMRIEACDRPCLHGTSPDQVLQHVKSILS